VHPVKTLTLVLEAMPDRCVLVKLGGPVTENVARVR
jgi:hypothetical protein